MNQAEQLYQAILEHWRQRADDRCHLDDEKLYAAAGLPPADIRVGDKVAMLANCARFIDKRCTHGGWRSYAELEMENARLREMCSAIVRWAQRTNEVQSGEGEALVAALEATLTKE